ncbi:circadian clock-controlled protein daywake-like [Melitaea cinxia]|uniref:circadian clock-controlled protein daywake-like n=1 Tax=Melitaea cinxia TaxID=113334 RepID=UPI001E271B1D|nr:circadian clock-controlled protein daywake-like [Melitaea cinxia]
MSARISLVLLVVCCFSGILSSDLKLPCEATDMTCLEKFVVTTRARLLRGIPELDIKPSDPLFLEQINGDLPLLKYKFFNTTLIGFNDCVLSNLKILRNVTSLQYDLDCPQLRVKGDYEMKGELVSSPVEGSGSFEIITGRYFVHVDYTLSKYQGDDGEVYLSGENLKLVCVPKTSVKFNFENLSDAAQQLARDHWREVTEYIQDPIWYACIKAYIVKMNKMLSTVPFKKFVVFNK